MEFGGLLGIVAVGTPRVRDMLRLSEQRIQRHQAAMDGDHPGPATARVDCLVLLGAKEVG